MSQSTLALVGSHSRLDVHIHHPHHLSLDASLLRPASTCFSSTSVEQSSYPVFRVQFSAIAFNTLESVTTNV